MWRITKIKAENFLVFKKIEVSLLQGETIFILGDKDSLSSDSNGAGKSSLLSAIRMTLLDSPDKEKTKDDYIRWGEKSAELELQMFNSFSKDELKINRILFKGTKSNVVRIFLNDIEKKDLVSVQDCNNFIIETIGIEKSDLLKYYVISQENKSFFLQSNDKEKKDIIWRFSGTERLEHLIAFTIDQLNSKERELNLLNEIKLDKLNEISLIEKEIDLINKFNEKSESNELVESLEEIILDKKTELKRCKTRLREVDLNDDCEEIDLSIGKEKKKLEKAEERLESISSKLVKIQSELKKASIALAGVIECPKCSHEFSPDLEIDSGEIKSLYEKLQVVESEYKVKKLTVKQSIDSIQNKIYELKQKRDDLKSKVRLVENLNLRIIEIEKDLQKTIENKNLLESKSPIKQDTEELERKLSKLQTLNKANNNKINRVTDEFVLLKGAKDKIQKSFKAYLINKSLSVLQEIINNKLRLLNFEYVLNIQGFKILKSGEIRENISIEVSSDEKNWFSFNSLSGGEKMRVSIATILAIQDIMNNTSVSGGLDLLILDETFDGLDQTGQTLAISLLQQTKRTILAVTHHRIEYEGAKIVIKNKNGVSYAQENFNLKKGRQEEDN